MIHLVQYIVFLAASSTTCVKTVLIHSGCFDQLQIRRHVKTFVNCKDKYGIFLFDAREKSFQQVSHEKLKKLIYVRPAKKNISSIPNLMSSDNMANNALSLESSFLTRAEKILCLALKDNKESSDLSIQLFQMIYSTFPDRINKNDFSITLMGNKTEKSQKFSLIDMIVLLLSESQVPNNSQILLYKFIQEYVVLPICFVKNTFLLKLSEQ